MAFPPLSQIAGRHGAIYDAYFLQADPSGSGSIGAIDAAVFLKKSSLNDATLSRIWELADQTGKSFLQKSGFYVALKLIALCQCGLDADIQQLSADIKPPELGPVTVQTSMDDTWEIKGAEKAKYDKIFDSLQPVNNLLSGDKVRPVLVNSKLAVDVLGRVWDLSDIDQDGFLDRNEFAVAMHLVYRALENDPVPATLPASMIPPPKRKSSLAGAVPVLPHIPAGAVQVLPRLPFPVAKDDPPSSNAKPAQQVANVQWVVTATARAGYDVMFEQVDTDSDGYVTGNDVKELMIQSRLDNSTLAHIWSLCDSSNTGFLNNEQFALAMYLIQQKISAGTDPPSQLTPEMVPPCQRPANTAANPTAFGVLDATNAGPHSHAADFSSMKHLDMIADEIEDMKKEKMECESQMIQREADIRIRQGDVQTLQKELDAITSTLKQLETQKQDAQKKLDELDDKKSNVESNVTEIREKCEMEQIEINQLNTQLLDQSKSIQMKEEEVSGLRDDLNQLRDEESRLEQLVEAGKSQLDSLAKAHDHTLVDITQVKKRLDLGIDQPVTVNGDLSSFDNDVFTSKRQSEQFTGLTTQHTHSVTPCFKQQPFANSDPFTADANISLTDLDPFQNEDPFKGSDPFKGGDDISFATGDPFTDAFAPTTKTQPAFGNFSPFSTDADPFVGAFGSTKTASADPFAPITGPSQKQKSRQKTGADLFGSDPFNPNAPKQHSESPRPSLPPKVKKAAPPRPAPPRPKTGPVSSSPAPDPFAGSGFTSDPFANSDPFASDDTKTDSNFAQFSPSKFSTEDTQMAWAMADSSRLERERWTACEQETADLQLALALSKCEETESLA